MKPRILIVEDKILIAEDLKDRIVKLDLGEISGAFLSGEEALDFAKDDLPDIAILDISLKGDMDGITLAEQLRDLGKIAVIYLTQHEDEGTISRIIPTSPVAYLNKPFTNNELKIAVLNAKKLKQEEPDEEIPLEREIKVLNDRIFIRNGRGKYFIPVEDILYIQSGGGEKSSIITKAFLNKELKSPPVVGYSLSKIAPRVAFYPYLVRCSRFHIVNLKYVQSIIDVDPSYKKKSAKILVIYGQEIKVGSKYQKEIFSRLRLL